MDKIKVVLIILLLTRSIPMVWAQEISIDQDLGMLMKEKVLSVLKTYEVSLNSLGDPGLSQTDDSLLVEDMLSTVFEERYIPVYNDLEPLKKGSEALPVDVYLDKIDTLFSDGVTFEFNEVEISDVFCDAQLNRPFVKATVTQALKEIHINQPKIYNQVKLDLYFAFNNFSQNHIVPKIYTIDSHKDNMYSFMECDSEVEQTLTMKMKKNVRVVLKEYHDKLNSLGDSNIAPTNKELVVHNMMTGIFEEKDIIIYNDLEPLKKGSATLSAEVYLKNIINLFSSGVTFAFSKVEISDVFCDAQLNRPFVKATVMRTLEGTRINQSIYNQVQLDIYFAFNDSTENYSKLPQIYSIDTLRNNLSDFIKCDLENEFDKQEQERKKQIAAKLDSLNTLHRESHVSNTIHLKFKNP